MYIIRPKVQPPEEMKFASLNEQKTFSKIEYHYLFTKLNAIISSIPQLLVVYNITNDSRDLHISTT